MSEEKVKCSTCYTMVDHVGTAYLHEAGRANVSDVCESCRTTLEYQATFAMAKDAVSKFATYVNGGSVHKLAEAFCNALQTEHRYLQNEVFFMLLECVYQYRNAPSDARNEAATKWAKFLHQAACRFPDLDSNLKATVSQESVESRVKEVKRELTKAYKKEHGKCVNHTYEIQFDAQKVSVYVSCTFADGFTTGRMSTVY